MVLQNAAGDGIPVWEAEAMNSPMGSFIQQIAFQCETHPSCFPRYFQSGILSVNSFIQLKVYKPGMYTGLLEDLACRTVVGGTGQQNRRRAWTIQGGLSLFFPSGGVEWPKLA